MWSLIKKDVRLNFVVIVGAVVFSTLPYALTAANLWVNPPEYRELGPRDYVESFQGAAFACLVIIVVLAAAFGGSAFALERRERTAEFLGMMPVSRGRIVLSKLLVAMLCLVVFMTPHVISLWATDYWAITEIERYRSNLGEIMDSAMLAAAYAFLLFCTAWTMSVFLRSPAIAACIAIVVGFAFFFGASAWIAKFLQRVMEQSRYNERTAYQLAAGIAAVTAMALLVLSTARYVRRIEP